MLGERGLDLGGGRELAFGGSTKSAIDPAEFLRARRIVTALIEARSLGFLEPISKPVELIRRKLLDRLFKVFDRCHARQGNMFIVEAESYSAAFILFGGAIFSGTRPLSSGLRYCPV